VVCLPIPTALNQSRSIFQQATPYYLRQGGYFFTFACLFVSRVTEKLANRFSHKKLSHR